MFLVILLFLVILFYPYREYFLDNASVNKLQHDFDDVFEKSKNSIRVDFDNYLKLYKDLKDVK